MKKRRQNKPTKSKPEAVQPGKQRFSLLGWAVLLLPLSVVLFVLIFGSQIPYLRQHSSSEAEDAAEVLCRYGMENMRAKMYQSAYARFIKALQIKPDFADAYINIGQIYYETGNIPEAIKWLEKALSLNPPQKDLLFNNLGLLYAKQGNLQKALSMFEQALTSGMKAEQVYNNLGNVNASLGNYQAAVEAYNNAIASRPTVRSMYIEMLHKITIEAADEQGAELMYQAASQQLESGISDGELSVYDSISVARFSRTMEREAQLYKNLARALAAGGVIDKAIGIYESVLKVEPRSAQNHYQLADFLMRKGELEKARRHLETALKLNPRMQKAREALDELMQVIDRTKK